MNIFSTGPQISLAEMLALRDERAALQADMLQTHAPSCLVCLSLNIPGPVKRGFLSDAFFRTSCKKLEALLAQFPLLGREALDRPGGLFLCLSLRADPIPVKEQTIRLEEEAPVCRLLDIDVLDGAGHKISRGQAGRPERRCLLCDRPAPLCARSRTHSVEQLQAHTRHLLWSWYRDDRAQAIGLTAQKALLYEVSVTPKPGLVDRNNTGSHNDMDFFTFLDSACALLPYFTHCARCGLEAPELPPEQALEQLRIPGRIAESEMLRATGGVNTHKGAIFSLGLLCAAAGRLSLRTAPTSSAEVAALAGRLSSPAMKDLGHTADTPGQSAFLHHHLTGARGEAAAGFPVELQALDQLKQHLARGSDINDALALVLLFLLTQTQDTNLVKRRGIGALDFARHSARELLSHRLPTAGELRALDLAFIRENLSPGGCADLLAVVCFLWFWDEAN